MKIEDLKELKEKLKKEKEKKIKTEGYIEATLKSLKDEYGCNSVEEAEQKLQELNTQIEKEEKQLDKLLDKIQKATDWSKL
jgi:ribosome-binding ATPase YchF (GTP1/OBG family)